MLSKLRYPRKGRSETDLVEWKVNEGGEELEGLEELLLWPGWGRMKDWE